MIISRQPNFDNEIKKITQELQHSRKMAKNWNEKVKRREEQLSEVNRLAILDFCSKNAMDYVQLRKVIDHLPPLGDIVATPEMSEEEIKKLMEQSTFNQDETEENLDLEVDSTLLEEDFSDGNENQELEEMEKNKEEIKEHDKKME